MSERVGWNLLLWIEGTAPLILVVVLIGWAYFFDGREAIQASQPNQIAILSALLGFCSTLLGFVIAVVTFLFGLVEKPAFRILRASRAYSEHWAIFRGALRACAAASLVSLVALVWGGSQSLPVWLIVALVGSVGWLLVRMGRVVWVLEKMMDAEIRLGANSRGSIREE